MTRTANAMAVPQPSVSRSISRIESSLQVKLIERNRNGITLTAAGERFQAHAREALRHSELASMVTGSNRSELSGEVRLAAPESIAGIIFVPLVKRFQDMFPLAKIRVMTSASVHIPTLMDNAIIDIGIIADTHPAPSGQLENLCHEDFYLIGSSTSRETEAETINLKRVATLPLILNAMQGGFRSRIDDAFQRQGLALRVMAEIDANEPLLDLVLDEAGFTILPFSSIARRGRVNHFSAARIVAPGITRNLKLIKTGRHPLPAIGRETSRLVRQIMTEQAAVARWQFDINV